jgi:glycosyltransferase involved in cell wall biosynthesis
MYLYQYDRPELGVSIGGTQRYGLDLGDLFYKMGYEVIFITKASKDTNVRYNDWATIISVKVPFGSKGNIQFSKKVNEICNRINPKLVCYSDLQIAWPYCYSKSFAIQHGVAWDNPYEKLKSILNKRIYRLAIRNLKRVICVDTNFINWLREHDSEGFANDKLVYIPNYADEKLFRYQYKEYTNKEKKVLLFPRRFVKHRGFEVFMDSCNLLINKGYNISPLLAIESFRKEEFIKKYPQYSHSEFQVVHPGFNEIANCYANAYLTIIPTLWSEGTSLSAIESISCGCPVIASDVGGLGNIVIPHFNGLIVPPTKETFTNAIEYLINNVEKRNEMAFNCRYLEYSFSKNRWQKDIQNTLKGMC